MTQSHWFPKTLDSTTDHLMFDQVRLSLCSLCWNREASDAGQVSCSFLDIKWGIWE